MTTRMKYAGRTAHKWQAVCGRCLLLLCLWLTALAASAQTEARYHIIQQGETLYRLTRIYNVSAKAICDANPGLTAENFKIGTKVLIPPSTPADLRTADSLRTVERQRIGTGIAGSNCREMHKVKKKDTLFGIAQKYGISLDLLMAANPETQKPGYTLKKGDVLCIPFADGAGLNIPTNKELFSSATGGNAGLKAIRVAVVMPLKGATTQSKRALEFYRGLLMGVETLKTQGTSFEIHAYACNPGGTAMETLLREPALNEADIVFGPDDSTQIAMLSRHLQPRKQLLVSPFFRWSPEVNTNPYLYAINPPARKRDACALGLFRSIFGKANVTMLFTDQPYSSFARMVCDSLAPAVEPLPKSPETLINYLRAGKENVIMLNAASVPEMNQLLTLVENVKRTKPEMAISVVGYPSWLQSDAVTKARMHKANTYVFNTNYMADAPASRQFLSQYFENFGTEMKVDGDNPAVYGYDCTMHLFGGLSTYGKAMNGRTNYATPIQYPISLQRATMWSGLVNLYMQCIHCKTDGTIDRITPNP